MSEFNILSGEMAVAIIIAAALIHASFQLGVSVLTLLSGHSFGRQTAHKRVVKLAFFYILGVLTMVLLVGCALLQLFSTFSAALASSLPLLSMIGIAISFVLLVLFYTSKQNVVWLPSPLVNYLENRTKKTKESAEAYSLGLMTTVAELPFVAVPLLLVLIVLHSTSPSMATGLYASYALLSVAPLLFVLAYIGSGSSISHIERWRQKNRRFLQIASCVLLFAVSAYLFVSFYLSPEKLTW